MTRVIGTLYLLQRNKAFVCNQLYKKKKFSLETKKKHLRNRFVKNLLVDSCYRLLCSCQLSEAPAVKASQIVTIPKI